MTRWFIVGLLTLTACGGGPAPPPEYTERSSAQKQCDALMDVWCESALDCVQAGLEPEEMMSEAELEERRSLCLDVAKQTCDATDSVGERYDECRANVEVLAEADCEAVQMAVGIKIPPPMPESCTELFVDG
jgi:hypothetical protein